MAADFNCKVQVLTQAVVIFISEEIRLFFAEWASDRNMEIIYECDHVYIHTNTQQSSEETLIAGRVYLLTKRDGMYLEWRAEDQVYSLDSGCEHDWNVVSSVNYRKTSKPNSDESGDAPGDNTRRYNISFDTADLKSYRHSGPANGLAHIIFILKDGTTFPALHFHHGGSKALFKELEKYVLISQSATDSRLFIVQEHDPDMLSQSLDELQLFAETSDDLVSKFIKDPYSTTLGGFSRVTNFFKDTLLQPDVQTIRPQSEVADLLAEDLSGVDVDYSDEPGFGVVTKTKLAARPDVTRGAPMTAEEWFSYQSADGQFSDVGKIKEAIFRGGVEPSIRMEVWKYLLGYFSWDSTHRSRNEERKRKVDDYFRMKLQWKTITAEQERRFTLLKERKNLIDKDVHRTDRNNQFFAGERNPNIQVLYDILMTYVMFNFDLGYVQGMSDLLSPILVIMENEVDAFWCFVGFMEMVKDNFEMDQNGMKKQLSQTHTLMHFIDPDLCSYLESHDSGNFYFCFRWILIQFKREFNFSDVMRLWEVLWTGLPCHNFHLLLSLAILDTEKPTLVENRFGFTEILKHINDISFSIDLDRTLRKAEGMFLQVKLCSKIPESVREILAIEKQSRMSMLFGKSAVSKSNSGQKLSNHADRLPSSKSMTADLSTASTNSDSDTDSIKNSKFL